MKKADLDTLQGVLTQAMNRDIAALAKIRERIDQARFAKAELGVTAQREFSQAPSLAEMQCYDKWSRWAGGKSHEYDHAREVLDEQAEVARKVLARSFGKTEAVKYLGETAEADELRAHRRKAEQNGQIPNR